MSTRLSRTIKLMAACGASLMILISGTTSSAAREPLLGSTLLHYRVECQPGERCNVECYQGGRIVVSRVRIAPSDRVSLVMTAGFSDRLQPLWLDIQPNDGKSKRTVLLPRDVLCDFQGLTVHPIAPG